jgi:ketosteroid isomerase-like protein
MIIFQTGTPRPKQGIEGLYKGHDGVMQFFSKLTGDYKYNIYDPYEFNESADGKLIAVAGHDAGTYADTGDKFITEWNHLWQFNDDGKAIMMRACNGELVNQVSDWDHTLYKGSKLNLFEQEKALNTVKNVIKHFAHAEYHKIIHLCEKDVQWLDMGRVLPGHNTSGTYKGHSQIRDLFLKYEQFYRFHSFEAVNYVISKDGTVITVQGHDSGAWVKDGTKVSSEWNHMFYMNSHGLIAKVRFISGEVVKKE